MEETDSFSVNFDVLFESEYSSEDPVRHHLITQLKLNYLVRNLDLSKKKSSTIGFQIARIEASKSTKISVFKRRHELLSITIVYRHIFIGKNIGTAIGLDLNIIQMNGDYLLITKSKNITGKTVVIFGLQEQKVLQEIIMSSSFPEYYLT